MTINTLQDPHNLHEEFCRVLTETRGGKGVGEAAKRILKNDSKGTQLVGINREGKIVTYSRSTWTVKAAALDTEGRHDQHESEMIETIETYVGLEQWIQEQSAAYFAWVHPRYRWLIK